MQTRFFVGASTEDLNGLQRDCIRGSFWKDRDRCRCFSPREAGCQKDSGERMKDSSRMVSRKACTEKVYSPTVRRYSLTGNIHSKTLKGYSSAVSQYTTTGNVHSPTGMRDSPAELRNARADSRNASAASRSVSATSRDSRESPRSGLMQCVCILGGASYGRCL
jgi:hypothetical protein